MLPIKFWFIWPSSFRGEDFLNRPIRNKNCLWAMVAMFVNGSGQNEHSLERTFHRCFLPSFTSFGWRVSEKIKMWKANGRQTTDVKWWQKLTLPLARWAKNAVSFGRMVGLYLKFRLYSILVFSGFGLDRFHCTYNVHISYWDYIYLSIINFYFYVTNFRTIYLSLFYLSLFVEQSAFLWNYKNIPGKSNIEKSEPQIMMIYMLYFTLTALPAQVRCTRYSIMW